MEKGGSEVKGGGWEFCRGEINAGVIVQINSINVP